MSYLIEDVSSSSMVEFRYANQTEEYPQDTVVIYMSVGYLPETVANDDPSLQSIGEALIPTVNANYPGLTPAADFALTWIKRQNVGIQVPIV